jgi:hypothetical protein
VLEIPLHSPHVLQLHVVHSPHAIDAHSANHSDDSQILFLSVDNTPASAECFEHMRFAILYDHAKPIPSLQLLRRLIRPRDCVFQTQPIRAGERLCFADSPVGTIGNPYDLPTADCDAVGLDLCPQRGPVVGALVEERNDSPQWCELLTRDLQQDG